MGKKYSLWLVAAMAVGAIAAAPARAADPEIEGCLVMFEEDVELGAREPGVLVQLKVKEGSSVKKGEVLGRIDDRESVIKQNAAKWAWGRPSRRPTTTCSSATPKCRPR